MRTHTWIGLLLAGVAAGGAARGQEPAAKGSTTTPWIPYTARGQSLAGGENLDLARPDPVIPVPLGHPRMDTVGGFYAASEVVIYRQTNPIKRQIVARRGLVDIDGAITGDINGTIVNTDTDAPFIIRGPIVPGNRLGSFTPALYTDDVRGQESWQPGVRATLGYRFDSGSAIELSWLRLHTARYQANASLIPENFAVNGGGGFLSDTFLTSEVVNAPPEFNGPAFETALGNPNSSVGIWNGAVNMSIAFEQRFNNVDIVGKVPWYQDDCTRCYGMAGGRYDWLFERFTWRTVGADFLGNSSPADVADYSNTVSQHMYGAVIGSGAERYLGYGFAVGVETQAALLADFVKERAKFVRGDKAIESKKAAEQFTVVPELNANVQLYWYPIEAVQIRVGYNFRALFNTVAAERPLPDDGNSQINFRSLDPDWKSRGVRYLDGFNAGIGLIF